METVIMDKTLNELRNEIHENAVKHGFYDVESEIGRLGIDNRTAIKHAFFAQKIALIHSELSEALDADRKNNPAKLNMFELLQSINQGNHTIGNDEFDKLSFEEVVKDTVGDELADVIIRVLDLCGYLEIDIEKHVELKMKYNELREHKHGKNY
jgi:NTP pyrophosphatase (non-canonical NTP hydrolase)